ncbi:MAG: glycosyltransferase family 4 protein [Bacteroidia bacterium]
MHIIGVHLLNNLSGSPRVFAEALNALSEAGHEVDLYTSKGGGFLDEVKGKKHRLYYAWSENRIMRLLFFSWSQLLLFFQMLKYWNKPVTFFINTLLPFGAAAAAWLMRKPVVYYMHETHISPASLDRFLRFWVKKTAKKAIYVSNFLAEKFPVDGPEKQVIHNSLPEFFFQQAQAKEAPSTPLKALMIASLKAEKGLQPFIKLSKATPNLQFSLVIGAPEAAVNSYFATISIPKNLTIYPAIQDISTMYACHDVLLNMSDPDLLPETFGMTVLEGFAWGLPAIVPPGGGPAELVRHGMEGFVLHPDETEAISQLLIQLSTDHQAWTALSANALVRSKDFDRESFGRKLVEVFETER